VRLRIPGSGYGYASQATTGYRGRRDISVIIKTQHLKIRGVHPFSTLAALQGNVLNAQLYYRRKPRGYQ
jgi:hypothetical protein